MAHLEQLVVSTTSVVPNILTEYYSASFDMIVNLSII